MPVQAAVEPGAGDAASRIQAAIDTVSKLPADAGGFRGAVLLKRGKYPVAGQIHIETGGVILRGEGQDANGTVIVATGSGKRSLIVIGRGKKRTADEEEGGRRKPRAAAQHGGRESCHWHGSDSAKQGRQRGAMEARLKGSDFQPRHYRHRRKTNHRGRAHLQRD